MRAAEPPAEIFPGATPQSAISVSDLTAALRDIIDGAFIPMWVRGEVTDFKAHRNGVWYFCLRDKGAQIKCVVWASDQRRIPAAPDDGMQVIALGKVGVYAARGDLQFSIKALQADGDGLWQKAMMLTLGRLEADGLLKPERKRPIPRFPRRIAVVTSLSGAAVHDVIVTARRRSPWVEIVIVPTRVQGEGSVDEICDAIDRVGRWGGADTLIVGRGGGGREDLWAFNDERVARAVARCPIPVISAVGHEVDLTICDLVADHRAATPSAAAEAAVPVAADLERLLARRAGDLTGAMDARLHSERSAAQAAARAMTDAVRRAVESRQAAVQGCAARLHALSPLATLARGYGVALGPDGGTLGSVSAFAPASRFDLQLRDGRVRALTETVVPASKGVASPTAAGR